MLSKKIQDKNIPHSKLKENNDKNMELLEKVLKKDAKPNPSLSPAVAALAIKELKAAAGAGVFLPRTVKNISKGMHLSKSSSVSKSHPLFSEQDEIEEVMKKPVSPKETEEDRAKKKMFASEVDKVFNAKPWPEERKSKGKWMPIVPVKEELKDEPPQESRNVSMDLQDHIKVEVKTETEANIFDDKAKDEDKKDRKEKKRKEKEEKKKTKKEKKEKKDKKKREKEHDTGSAVDMEDTSQGVHGEAYNEYGHDYGEYPEAGYEQQGWYDDNGEFHPHEEGDYFYYYDAEGNIVGYEGPEGYVEGNPFEVCSKFLFTFIFLNLYATLRLLNLV